MKYCSHCGNQLVDEAVICPQCGCPAENSNGTYANNSQPVNNNSVSTLALIGFIFSFIQVIVGLICSIVAYRTAVSEGNEKSKNFAKAGIIISSVLLGLSIVLTITIFLIAFFVGVNYPDYVY